MEDWRDRVKIFYDAEFTGLHRNTSLISIGMVSQSGAYFYAEFNDYNKSQVSDWIQENVINSLLFNNEDFHMEKSKFVVMGYDHINIMMKGDKNDIRLQLLTWLKNESTYSGKKIQFYTDCYAYDWMTLNDLICDRGDALNLPDYIDYIPIDLSTALWFHHIDPDITREDFVSDINKDRIKSSKPFKDMGDRLKHNCLWDATICNLCFWELTKLDYMKEFN
ncbi:MAG: 3'-5' exoribonuclease [Lachnospiraceae bacterium]|nr:3'-5' exoribonuclease [Lachnospiraceae bacterium]MCM1231997.1 3'-5' exoribonuclease [Ruminococcus flavefaciens]